jgi:hypothetical protein
MAITTADLKEIARAGGGIRIDAAGYATADIKEIGRAVGASGATIILKNADTKTTEELKAIARTSPGNFIFEL